MRLIQVADNLDSLASILRDLSKAENWSLDDLFDNYSDIRRRLSRQVSEIAQAQLGGANSTLANATTNVQNYLWRVSGSQIPLEKLRISQFRAVHALLLQYLLEHAGSSVTAERLRYITADQTHTERRVRELRELGFIVRAVRVSGLDSYLLESASQDLAGAAKLQARRLIRSHNRLSKAEADLLANSLAEILPD